MSNCPFHSDHLVLSVQKPKRCDYCGQWCKAGNPAVRQTGVWEGDFYSVLMHSECWRAWRYWWRLNPGEEEGPPRHESMRGVTMDSWGEKPVAVWAKDPMTWAELKNPGEFEDRMWRDPNLQGVDLSLRVPGPPPAFSVVGAPVVLYYREDSRERELRNRISCLETMLSAAGICSGCGGEISHAVDEPFGYCAVCGWTGEWTGELPLIFELRLKLRQAEARYLEFANMF